MDDLARARRSFAQQGAMAHLGAVIVHLTPGEVAIALPFRAEVGQHHGLFHGGVIATVLDVACGLAALTRMAPGHSVVSAEFKLNFLAPARGASLVARGRVVRAGRLLTICTGDAFVDDDRHVALMQATMCAIPE